MSTLSDFDELVRQVVNRSGPTILERACRQIEVNRLHEHNSLTRVFLERYTAETDAYIRAKLGLHRCVKRELPGITTWKELCFRHRNAMARLENKLQELGLENQIKRCRAEAQTIAQRNRHSLVL